MPIETSVRRVLRFGSRLVWREKKKRARVYPYRMYPDRKIGDVFNPQNELRQRKTNSWVYYVRALLNNINVLRKF